MGRPVSPLASRGSAGGETCPSDQDDKTRTGGCAGVALSSTARSNQEDGASTVAIDQAKPPSRQKDFTAMTRLILVGTLLLLSLAFFLQNQEQEVTLRYFFGLLEASTPIYKPIMAGFVIGLLVATILLFPPWIRGRIDLRRKTKALQEAEVNLERLRQSLEKMSGRTQGSTQMESSRDLVDE
jgi:uncharacterized integral membrane protein